MAGNREGGLKAAARNLANDPNFYAKIGAIGGRNGNTGGFAVHKFCNCDIIAEPHKVSQCAGYKGGLKSRRKKVGGE